MGETLSVRGLHKRFGRVVVAADITFEVPGGSYCAVLGPSGSGKTSLFNMVAGLIRPDAGTIALGATVFDGAGRHLPPERRGVGLVFQDYALWPHLPVREQVAFGMRLRRRPRAEIARETRRWLQLLRIDNLAPRYPHELSGGQKQRVAIARALAARPSLVLLDEPFSNLDAPLREGLRDELSSLYNSMGLTVVHVTHDRQEAMGAADRILVLDGGELCQEGAPQDLYHNPARVEVATLLGAANLVPGRARTEGPLASLDGEGLTLRGAPAPRLAEGQAVAFFRPEAVRLLDGAPRDGLGNAFAARVERTGWHETGWRHRLRVGGHAIAVLSPVAAEPGTEVWVHVPVEACRILPPAAAAAAVPEAGGQDPGRPAAAAEEALDRGLASAADAS